MTIAPVPSDAKAPKAKAPTVRPTRRTTPKAPKVTADPIARLVADDGSIETDAAYIERMTSKDATRPMVDAATAVLRQADDTARILTFEDRVYRGWSAGRLAVSEARILTGAEPADFAAIAKALDVSKDGGDYLGRRYSALRESWRLSVNHTAEAMASFVAAYREATGQNPERVREYVQWVDARSESFRDAKVIGERINTAAANAAKAKAESKAKAVAAVAIKSAGVVTGVPIDKATWLSMSIETLREVAMLATALATDKAEAKRKADRKAEADRKANAAAAESGAKAKAPKRAPAVVK